MSRSAYLYHLIDTGSASAAEVREIHEIETRAAAVEALEASRDNYPDAWNGFQANALEALKASWWRGRHVRAAASARWAKPPSGGQLVTPSRRHSMKDEERYEDCDRCGERYNGEFIDQYLRDEEVGDGEVRRVCCPTTPTALELKEASR